VNARKLAPLLLVLAGLLAYQNSFTAPFVFDDTSSILNNDSIRHLWPIGDALSPPSVAGVGGRPVFNLSLAVNYALGGYNVWGYHALNLAIHILAGLTLLGVVRRTLLQPALRERFGAVANELALATAVLWTVHPLQTESVTYVSERCESLMGLFYLLTLYCFICGTASPSAGLWFMLSVATCLLGMATKEVMVTAPLIVLLHDRTFVAGSFRAAWKQRWRLYTGLAATWLLLGYLLIGLHYRKVGYGLGLTWQAYAMTECRSVVSYFWLAIWPHPLVFDYGSDTISNLADAAPYALILLVLIGVVVIALKRWPAIGFLGAWPFVILAPASSVIPVVGQPMAEHRMYLPLAAVITLVVMGIYALMGRRSVGVFLVLAVGLGLLTAQRNEDYRTKLSIWTDTVAKCPDNVRARSNLGRALLNAGRMPEAIEQYEQALRIQPNFAPAHDSLANALVQEGRLDEAIRHYEQALRFDPGLVDAHYDFGLALEKAGRVPEAIQQYEQALRLRPGYTAAQTALARLQGSP
jgi:protein O-mannosyl-transferase